MKIHIKESELVKLIEQALNEQYQEGTVGLGGGATSTDSSGSYDSAGSWKKGGILTGKGRKGKDGRKKIKTNTDMPDSFTGGWQTVDTGMKTDGTGKISSAVGNNISQPDDDKQTDPRDRPALVNRYHNPYDDDNPRRRPDPKGKGSNPKDWRSPPCCESCGGGKWRRCQGGAKKPGACKYNSITDCQMLGNPKGNLKPLKLKSIYENREPSVKRKVMRITESDLKRSIEKVMMEQDKEKKGLPGVGESREDAIRRYMESLPPFPRNLNALQRVARWLLRRTEEWKKACIGKPGQKMNCNDSAFAKKLQRYIIPQYHETLWERLFNYSYQIQLLYKKRHTRE